MKCPVSIALALLALCACGGVAPAQPNEATATAGAGATIVTGLDVRAGGGELAVSGGPYATYSVTISWPASARGPGQESLVLALVAGPGGTCLAGTAGSWAMHASALPRPGACEVIIACN